MEDESLAGQKATIKMTDGKEVAVVFGPDVKLQWVGGKIINSKSPAVLHPEITGSLKTKEDHSDIKDAELILDDQRVFKVSFLSPNYFSAHESINSRNRVY